MSELSKRIAREIVEYLFDDYPDNNEVRGDAMKNVAAMIAPHLAPADAEQPTPEHLIEQLQAMDDAPDYGKLKAFPNAESCGASFLLD